MAASKKDNVNAGRVEYLGDDREGKLAALNNAVAAIEKNYGKGSIMKLGDSGANIDIEAIPTGSISLDVALGVGGVPRGRIIEIYGPESSGKTTVALHMIAEAQKRNGIAGFIDAEHALDPQYAKKIGVDIDNLYISQPDNGEQALEIAETMIRSGALDIVIVDSVAALVPKAEIEGDMDDQQVGLLARSGVVQPFESQSSAHAAVADNGYDIDQLIEQSKSPDFKPISLKSTVTVSMRNTFDRQQSPNVIGYIPGSGNTDESVIYLGHWDHLGYGAPINGDSIINGATDNAVAIAWMLEMARCFNALKEKPRRNIVFLSPTCEETGFLGTKYYVEHPLFPIDKIAAVINLDVFPLWGENNDVTITGYGNSELDDTLAELAKKYNRYIMPDPDAYNGMFYRSDHFPFVQKGIPAMFAKGWNDNRKQGKEWAKEHIAR